MLDEDGFRFLKKRRVYFQRKFVSHSCLRKSIMYVVVRIVWHWFPCLFPLCASFFPFFVPSVFPFFVSSLRFPFCVLCASCFVSFGFFVLIFVWWKVSVLYPSEDLYEIKGLHLRLDGGSLSPTVRLILPQWRPSSLRSCCVVYSIEINHLAALR